MKIKYNEGIYFKEATGEKILKKKLLSNVQRKGTRHRTTMTVLIKGEENVISVCCGKTTLVSPSWVRTNGRKFKKEY